MPKSEAKMDLEELTVVLDRIDGYTTDSKKRDEEYRKLFKKIRLRLRTVWNAMWCVEEDKLPDAGDTEQRKKRISTILSILELCEREFDELVENVRKDIEAAKIKLKDAQDKLK